MLLVFLPPGPMEDAMGPDPCYTGSEFVLQLKSPGLFEKVASTVASSSCMVVWSCLWSP